MGWHVKNPIRIICIYPPSVSIPTSHKHNSSILIGIQRINYQTKALMSPSTIHSFTEYIVQFTLGGETIQCIYYPLYPQTIQIHLSPNILACSCLWKMNSVSLESWVNGEYDRPFESARLPVAWPSLHSLPRITHSLWIHPILRILACSDARKAMSGVLESSHCALSIDCSFKTKYRCFANWLNSRGG